MADTSQVDVALIMTKYAKKLAAANPFVANELISICKSLKSTQKKHIVYQGYLGEDVITLLSIANAQKLASGPILQEYAPIRKIVIENAKTIKTALTLPLLLSVFVVLILAAVISKLSAAESVIQFSPISVFLMHNFAVINLVFITGLMASFFYIPKKVPILSRMYKKLDALLAISLASTMFNIGLAAKAVIPIIRKQFNITKHQDGRGDIAELAQLFEEENFFSLLESADIELAMEYSKFESALEEKKNDKLADANRFGTLIGDIVKNFALFVMAMPIFQFLIIILDLIQKSTSMAAQ
ncbi:MAG: hypothetical protein A3F91_09260 [Flavobacteria bacterium RIFCSPLOWO2_12_FULL_35_11]|nr:MAG: hypothetical protein A3F91_09260 [Flavobacteria bacterium RIFCSPLOWO2_12_FULL_35_11]